MHENEKRKDERRKRLGAWNQWEGRREVRMTEGTEGAKGIEKEQKEERGNGRERRKLSEGRILRGV